MVRAAVACVSCLRPPSRVLSNFWHRLILFFFMPCSVNGDGLTALMAAVLTGHPGVMEVLLGAGCDPNIPDARGVTPIHAAAAQVRNRASRESEWERM